ncbi:universal stress protein [Streptomyces chromofuscus]|nr:hypothetical protein GCM10010254_21490 [Streptomyces chromofuscus]
MRAHLGDQLAIEGPATGVTRRDGEIVGRHHVDGTPPYPHAPVGHGRRPVGIRPGALDPGHVGRRVAVERRGHGLSRRESARRAHISPDRPARPEERTAEPAVATHLTAAAALGATATALRGAGVDLPPVVVGLGDPTDGSADDAAGAHEERASTLLTDALRDAVRGHPQVEVHRRTVEAPAHQVLLDASHDADLVVVGAGRRHGHAGLQLGRVAHALLHHGACPVVVVPRRA